MHCCIIITSLLPHDYLIIINTKSYNNETSIMQCVCFNCYIIVICCFVNITIGTVVNYLTVTVSTITHLDPRTCKWNVAACILHVIANNSSQHVEAPGYS